MMYMIQNRVWLIYVGAASIAINLMVLFGGICGDPGVKPKTYLHYAKMKYQADGDLTSSDEETKDPDEAGEEDVENADAEGKVKNRSMKKDKLKKAQQAGYQYRPEK